MSRIKVLVEIDEEVKKKAKIKAIFAGMTFREYIERALKEKNENS